MSPIDVEKMIAEGMQRIEVESEQFNRDYAAASQRIRNAKGKMTRHEYLLRDRPVGKPPDKSVIGE
jgi:hypothetical protein